MLKPQKKPIINIAALSVVAIVFLVASLALAQGPGQGMGGKRGQFHQGQRGNGQGHGMGMTWSEDGGFNRFDRMALRLDLNDDQKAAIKKLQEDNREANLSLRTDMMRLRNEMQGEMMKDDPAEKTVLAISAKMSDIKGELQANRLKTRLAVRKELTSEQRDQMLLMGGQGNGQGPGAKGGFQGRGNCNGNAGSGRGPSGGGFRGNCR